MKKLIENHKPFIDALLYKPKLLERKKVYGRLQAKFNDLIETFEDHTGLIGIASPHADYDSTTLEALSHFVGDRVIYFSDEVQRSSRSQPLVMFNLYLDQAYSKQLSSLNQYSLGNQLLSHGVVNDDILSQYLAITGQFTQLFEEYDLPSIHSTHDESGLLWSFTEAREGSTVLEFVLQYWDSAAMTVGGVTASVGAFLAAYPKMSDGLKRLQDDAQKLCAKKQPEDINPMIILDNIDQEFKQAKADREQHH